MCYLRVRGHFSGTLPGQRSSLSGVVFVVVFVLFLGGGGRRSEEEEGLSSADAQQLTICIVLLYSTGIDLLGTLSHTAYV